MKTTSITPRTDTILRLADNLQAIDGGLIQSQAFYDFLRFQRDVKQRIDATWAEIETFMRTNNIPTVKGDWGHMTLSDGKTLYAYDEATLTDPIFYKQSLDTAAVKNHKGLFGTLPEGVTEGKGKPYLDKTVSKKW